MNKKQVILYIGIVLVCLVALVGTTFAYFTKTLTGTKKVSMKVGKLAITFESGNVINLANLAPTTDTVGMRNTPYTFTITNTGTIPAYYNVYLEEDTENNTLSNMLIRYSLTGTNGYSSGIGYVGTRGNNKIEIVPPQNLKVGESVQYTLHMWLSNNAGNDAQGKTYKSKIVVESVSSK